MIFRGVDMPSKDKFFLEMDGDTYYCIKTTECIDCKNISEDIRQMNDDNFKERVNDNFKFWMSGQSSLTSPPPYITLTIEQLMAKPPDQRRKIFKLLNIQGKDKMKQFVELQKLFLV